MTNLTLTVDETLLRKARILALERGTSVNALVREFIEKLIQDSARSEDKAQQFAAFAEQGKVASFGFKMTRQEMYETDPRMQRLFRIGNPDANVNVNANID